MPGRHFCCSHSAPRDLEWCLQHGASVLMDNGAFSAWTKGRAPDWAAYATWVAPHLRHPHWCIIPDTIDGTEADNDALLASWSLPRQFSAPVWHLHESTERLAALAAAYPRICLGSSGAYAQPGTPRWRARIDEAWAAIDATGAHPWVHMLRAMADASAGPWPFASADSTRIARGHAGDLTHPARLPEMMAQRIDARNPSRPRPRMKQGSLL
jgi:hypothetical protein